MPTRISTRTRWNRLRPIFLDLHIEAQAEAATQGTLDFDEPEENDSKNDELILTRTAIVGLLAEYLAGVLDKREQFGSPQIH